MSENQEQTFNIPKDPLTAVISFDDNIRGKLVDASHSVVIAQSFEIENLEDAQHAVAERNTNLQQIKELEAAVDSIVKPAKEIIARINSIFKPGIERRKEAVGILNNAISSWTEKENKRIAIENAEREAEARKIRQKAEAEAAAAQAKANQEAADKRRQAEEAEAARKKAEEEGNAKAAKEAAEKAAKLQEQAKSAEESGAAKAQQTMLSASVAATSQAITPAKIAGNTSREKWIAELKPNTTEDQAKALIVAGAASRPALLALLDVNVKAIRKQAESLHAAMDVPGYVAKKTYIQAGKTK